ncbi:unnamed protein product [Heligmosomoides polygyrus]|uniref:TIL domain-containing protein n=1 Tax=Heligmosomoides polygyrus TaxID=6339 RepID=A0A183FI10_HELPZ|nr:unnamed protein product [Heligmosomoides polygyrus]
MASSRLLLDLLALTAAVSAQSGQGEPMESSGGIVPCREMYCPYQMHCEEGRVICPFVPPCFTRPTRCVPDELNGPMEELGGSGEEGSGGEQCPPNMYKAPCGPACPQDCTKEPQCLSITCSNEGKCFCKGGYVLLVKGDPILKSLCFLKGIV